MCPYTIFKEEDLITCENPKIQPVFSTLAFQPFLVVHRARYQNFGLDIDDSGSNESLTDFVG